MLRGLSGRKNPGEWTSLNSKQGFLKKKCSIFMKEKEWIKEKLIDFFDSDELELPRRRGDTNFEDYLEKLFKNHEKLIEGLPKIPEEEKCEEILKIPEEEKCEEILKIPEEKKCEEILKILKEKKCEEILKILKEKNVKRLLEK